MLKTVAVVLIDGSSPFEIGVVCEVFGIDRTEEGVPAIDFRICGEHPGQPLPTSVGFSITPTHGLDALHDADLVALPAATPRDHYPPVILQAIRDAHARGATLLSVCSGAYLLGATGLLDGRPCTTHWRYAADFTRRYPETLINPDVLYVDDGTIITSAGTAAGIDACLHLVRRELGTQHATTIARRMVVPPQRDGGQRQYVQTPLPHHTNHSLQPLLTWVVQHLDTPHTISSLAHRARTSPRTFTRRFTAETGTTPHRWLTQQRILHAQQLLENTTLSMDQIAQACGLNTAPLLRHHFHQQIGITPTQYRTAFAHRPTAGAPGARGGATAPGAADMPGHVPA